MHKAIELTFSHTRPGRDPVCGLKSYRPFVRRPPLRGCGFVHPAAASPSRASAYPNEPSVSHRLEETYYLVHIRRRSYPFGRPTPVPPQPSG